MARPSGAEGGANVVGSNCCPHGCPCGHYGDSSRACTCAEAAVSRYRKRLSGPLLDRIDLHVEVPRVEYDKLASDGLAEPSAAVRERVEAARARQWARFEGTRLTSNAEMGVREVRRWCVLDSAGEALLRAAVQQLGLSARAYHRVLKVARTIADLAAADSIQPAHLAEAIWSTSTQSRGISGRYAAKRVTQRGPGDTHVVAIER